MEYIGSGSGTQYPLIINPDGTIPVNTVLLLTQAIENNAQGQPVYIGEAAPGTNTGSAAWRVRKITYTSDNFVSGITWASGNIHFDKIWTGRGSSPFS